MFGPTLCDTFVLAATAASTHHAPALASLAGLGPKTQNFSHQEPETLPRPPSPPDAFSPANDSTPASQTFRLLETARKLAFGTLSKRVHYSTDAKASDQHTNMSDTDFKPTVVFVLGGPGSGKGTQVRERAALGAAFRPVSLGRFRRNDSFPRAR